ncbi:GNAT family N-acetyltransferase [Kitasatospora acidiphila]|uniref:GNAT family N-acetyltransferase n=1 Tax=Kitasatospora acidiphila TaxID=2567942 RepID=UPI003C7231D5
MELRHYTELTLEVRRDLLAVYVDVRAPLLHLANYRVEAFAERLDRHAGEPGFEVVLGYDRGEAIGYAYVNALSPDDRWWKRMAEPLPAGFTALSTVALKEIGVRAPWRGTGVARRIHDALLAHRTEERVTLLVNPLAGDGKVQALYESWGYVSINAQQPAPESPRLIAMVRANG